jgi:WD40 repeat protein
MNRQNMYKLVFVFIFLAQVITAQTQNSFADLRIMWQKYHGGDTWSVAINHNKSLIARAKVGGDKSQNLSIFDLKSGQNVFNFPLEHDVFTNVEFSKSGNFLAFSGSGILYVFRTETFKEVFRTRSYPNIEKNLEAFSQVISAIKFSNDEEKIVATYSDYNVRSYNVRTGYLDKTFTLEAQYLNAIDFSPDNRQIIVTSIDNSTFLIDFNSGKLIRKLRQADNHSVAIHPDGKSVIFPYKTSILWIDLQTGRELGTFLGHKSNVWQARFTPDGKTIVSSAFSDNIIFWDLATGKILHQLKANIFGYEPFALSQDSVSLALGVDDGLRLYQHPNQLPIFKR